MTRRQRRWSIVLLIALALYAVPQVVVALFALAYFGTFALALGAALLGHSTTDLEPWQEDLARQRLSAWTHDPDREIELLQRHDD